MARYTSVWSNATSAKMEATATAALYSGEELWYLGAGSNSRPRVSEIALTELRFLALSGERICFQVRYTDIETLTTDEDNGTITVVRHDGESIVIKRVPNLDFDAIKRVIRRGLKESPRTEVLAAASQAITAQNTAVERAQAARNASWPLTRVSGPLSRKASEAILRYCGGDEHPWFILSSAGFAGTLVAFEDRLVIIKTGGWTGLAAGAMGGERSATFHLPDITGIEYNSGIFNGVLEVLTPSYDGSANKDYWRGNNSPRNVDSNDPFTSSNTLPLSKSEYRSNLAEINEIQSRISQAKRPISVQVQAEPPAPVPGYGLADQLKKLAELKEAGILTDDEFAAGKARLLS